MKALPLAALLLLLLPGLAAAAPMGGALDCSGGSRHTIEGFAPLSVGESRTITAEGWRCYQLFVEPGFPFRGDITVTLTDAFGNAASAHRRCDLSGFESTPGVVGCTGLAVRLPPLAPGQLTLAVRVTDGLVPIGSWRAGASFGN